MNYYELFEVSPTASQEVIDAAYRALAKKYHPDTNKQTDAVSKMKMLNTAYEILSDSTKRNEYNREIETNATAVVQSASFFSRDYENYVSQDTTELLGSIQKMKQKHDDLMSSITQMIPNAYNPLVKMQIYQAIEKIKKNARKYRNAVKKLKLYFEELPANLMEQVNGMIKEQIGNLDFFSMANNMIPDIDLAVCDTVKQYIDNM